MPLGNVPWRCIAALCLAVVGLARAADPTDGPSSISSPGRHHEVCVLERRQKRRRGCLQDIHPGGGAAKGKADFVVQVFDDIASFRSAVQSNDLSLIIIDTWRYLSMTPSPGMKPCFASSERESPGKRYVVLAPKDGPIQSLEDLRGKELVEIDLNNTKIASWWLDTTLRVRVSVRERPSSVGSKGPAARPQPFCLCTSVESRPAWWTKSASRW